MWCSNGRISDWGICMARTDHDAAPHKGISFFLVDMHLPGVDVRPLRQMTGGAEFDEVFLDDVRVPVTCLLGPENEGWKVGMATLTNERGHIGASTISLQRRLDSMAALGGGLDAVHRDELAALVARGRTYLALAQRQGPVASVAASLMKLGVTELLFDVAVLRTELAGADGNARERRVPRRVGCTCRPHRRRHDAGPTQHHRRNASSACRRNRDPDPSGISLAKRHRSVLFCQGKRQRR